MKLKLVSLEIEHFKGFVARQSLALDVGPGLHFVRGRNDVEPRLGSNGAGKSSLWAALSWVLWGKTVDGLKNPDIKPWSGKGTPTVSLLLDIDDHPHTITRWAKTNGLALDGAVVGQDTVDELLQMNFDLFANTVLLGQGRPLFFDLTPSGKMELFTAVLDLERWEQRADLASKTARLVEQDVATATGELTGTEGKLAQAVALLATTEELAAEWTASRKTARKELEATKAELDRSLKALTPKLAQADLALDGAETERAATQKQLGDALAGLYELERARDRREAELKAAERREAELTDHLEQAVATGRCPTCGQTLKGETAKKHDKSLTEQIAAAQAEVKALGPGRNEGKKIGEAKASVAALKEALADFEAKAVAAQSQVNLYQPDVVAKSERLIQVNTRLDAFDRETNPHSTALAELRRRRTTAQDQIKELREEIEGLQARLERTRYWVKGFKDVRLYIVEQVLQELELTTNAVAAELGLGDWEVQYAVEKETKAGTISRGLSVFIFSPASNEPARWEAWSGGEGQRLRIAGALALSEVLLGNAGLSVDTEILDEPTMHLSAEGVRDLCEALAERAAALGKQIWYVDHMSVESSHFASVTTVVKGKGGSVINQGD